MRLLLALASLGSALAQVTNLPTIDNAQAVAPTMEACSPDIYSESDPQRMPVWVGPTATDGATPLFCTNSKTETSLQCQPNEACVATAQNTNEVDKEWTFECVDIPPCCLNQPCDGPAEVSPTSQCCKWALESECDKNPAFMKLVCQAECGTIGCTPDLVFTSCPTAVNPGCKPAPAGPFLILAVPTALLTGQPGAKPGSHPGTQGSTGDSGGDGSGTIGGMTCADNHGWCPGWAAAGECSANEDWMVLNCRRSCQTCASDAGDAVAGCSGDKHGWCGGWAALGECQANRDWMTANCNTSCGCGSAAANPAPAVSHPIAPVAASSPYKKARRSRARSSLLRARLARRQRQQRVRTSRRRHIQRAQHRQQ